MCTGNGRPGTVKPTPKRPDFGRPLLWPTGPTGPTFDARILPNRSDNDVGFGPFGRSRIGSPSST